MATIEPRLMHLLNDAQSPDLPPKRPTFLPVRFASSSASSTAAATTATAGTPGTPVSLPPLELDSVGGQRGDTQIPSFHTIADDVASRQLGPLNATGWTAELAYQKEGSLALASHGASSAGSRPGKLGVHPLQLLLETPETTASSNSLRMILDDNPPDVPTTTTPTSEDPSNKKRQRGLTVKDDFVQLPHPLKKQKSTQNVLPPIINNLVEPPPDAAMFPPISSGTFDDGADAAASALKLQFGGGAGIGAGGSGNITGGGDLLGAELGAAALKSKRRVAKPRRKWTEEETNHLLLGVSRHGVGKWTTILEDPDYVFNERTAGDLKDRFRTCCPDELRGKVGKGGGGGHGKGKKAAAPPTNPTTTAPSPPAPAPEPKTRQKHGLQLENILIEPESEELPVGTDKGGPPSSQPDSDSGSPTQQQPQPYSPPQDGASSSKGQSSQSQPQPRKSRAHRKKMEDLVELGIRAPFKKSHRRERRPFTEDDDKRILEGLERYGPAWTKIQRDPRYDLGSRQPTDLRDRVRNKYPDVYARIEKGSFAAAAGGGGGGKESSAPGRGSNSLLEPSVNTSMENSLLASAVGGGKAGAQHGHGHQHPFLNRVNSGKEDLLKWPFPSTLLDPNDALMSGGGGGGIGSGGSTFLAELNEPSAVAVGSSAGVGEMDISRLLLDDSQMNRLDGGHEKGPSPLDHVHDRRAFD